MNQINISSPLQASSITITVTISSHYYDSVCCQVLTLPELRTNWGSCDLVTCLLSLASATVETIRPDMQRCLMIYNLHILQYLENRPTKIWLLKVVSTLLVGAFFTRRNILCTTQCDNLKSVISPQCICSESSYQICHTVILSNITYMSASDHLIPWLFCCTMGDLGWSHIINFFLW